MIRFTWNTTLHGVRHLQINTSIHYLNASGNDVLHVCILLKLWIHVPDSITKNMELKFLTGPLKDFFLYASIWPHIYLAIYVLSWVNVKGKKELNLTTGKILSSDWILVIPVWFSG